MLPLEAMSYDVSRFTTLFRVVDEGDEEEAVLEFGDLIEEISDEELSREQEQELAKDLVSSSSGSLPFICRRCPKRFPNRQELSVHRLTHRPKRVKTSNELTCEKCGKAFQRRHALVAHLNAHSGVRNFQCPQCPARFVQRCNRDSHVRNTHHQVYSLSCPEPGCGRHFRRRRERDQHVKSVHRKERDIVCGVCQAIFCHGVNFKKHLTMHTSEKPYGCDICGKYFNRPENRDIHLFVHSVNKAYMCGVCGADFMRRHQLVTHSKATGHRNERIVRQKPQFSPAFANITRNRKEQEQDQQGIQDAISEEEPIKMVEKEEASSEDVDSPETDLQLEAALTEQAGLEGDIEEILLEELNEDRQRMLKDLQDEKEFLEAVEMTDTYREYYYEAKQYLDGNLIHFI